MQSGAVVNGIGCQETATYITLLESSMANVGTLPRDVNGSGEYLWGQLQRESPEALA
jgi:hypothetical protein